MINICNALLIITFVYQINAQTFNTFTETKGTAIAGWNTKVMKTDIESCKKACLAETEFVCKSMDYIRSSRECKMSTKTKGDTGVVMVSSNDYIYFQKIINTVPVSQVRAEAFTKSTGKYLSGNNDKRVSTDIEGCKKACLAETTFVCKSFDYVQQSSKSINDTCILSKKAKRDSGVIMGSSAVYFYFERVFNTTKPVPAQNFTELKGWTFSGQKTKTLSQKSIDQCKAACSAEQSFVCKSFDYNLSGRLCSLSKKAKGDSGVLMTSSSNYTYFLRVIKPVTATAFIKSTGKYLSGNNDKTLNTDIEGCKRACLAETTFVCKSFDYVQQRLSFHQNLCTLSKKAKGDSGVSIGSKKVQFHFERVFNTTKPIPVSSAAFTKSTGKYLVNNNDITFNADIEECKRACLEETTIVCKSFDYVQQRNSLISQNICTLSKKAKGDSGVSIGSKKVQFYFERVFNTTVLAEAFTKSTGQYLSGNNDKRLSTDIEGCKKACLAETTFVCKSFDYVQQSSKRVNNTCILSKKATFDSDVIMGGSAVYFYFERVFNTTIPVTIKSKSCSWKKFPNKDLGGNDVIYGKTWFTKTPQECQTKCDAQPRCNSIMWATNQNPNRLYRKLCWLKTKGKGYESSYRRGRGIDVYQRNVCSTPVVAVKPPRKPDSVSKNKTLMNSMFSKSQDREFALAKQEQSLFQQGTKNRKVDGMRGKVFNYFNFAIVNGRTDYKNLGECSDACSTWKQKCCASMTMSRGSRREFQYVCINNAVANGDGVKMDLADVQVEIQCNDVYASAFYLKALVSSMMLALIAFN